MSEFRVKIRINGTIDMIVEADDAEEAARIAEDRWTRDEVEFEPEAEIISVKEVGT